MLWWKWPWAIKEEALSSCQAEVAARGCVLLEPPVPWETSYFERAWEATQQDPDALFPKAEVAD